MTEIEKARRGTRWVDLNKLAEELGAEFDELHGMMKDCARRELAGEKVSRENDVENDVERLPDAAADVMLAVNAMINKVNAHHLLGPVLMAGVAACADLIKGTFDDGDRKLMEGLSEKIISRSTVNKYKAGNHDED